MSQLQYERNWPSWLEFFEWPLFLLRESCLVEQIGFDPVASVFLHRLHPQRLPINKKIMDKHLRMGQYPPYIIYYHLHYLTNKTAMKPYRNYVLNLAIRYIGLGSKIG